MLVRMTSRAGVFAAGDVRAGSINRVAAAVGEGSTAGAARAPIPRAEVTGVASSSQAEKRRSHMGTKLEGKKVAFVVTDGFEQTELTGPLRALEEEGADCDVISPKEGKVKGWQHGNWADEIAVDVVLKDADASSYDALVLPGGVMNPDKLRIIPEVLAFVRKVFDAGKPVGAICHGPWTLIDAGCVEDRTMTSWPSVRTDLVNAGAKWVDEEVVCDEGLVTSRKPDDLPAFSRKVIEEIAEGVHGEARAKRIAARRPAAGAE